MIGKAIAAGIVVGAGLGLLPMQGTQDTHIQPPLGPVKYVKPPTVQYIPAPSVDQPDLNGILPTEVPEKTPMTVAPSDWCRQRPDIENCGILFT
jgi:hypothetical protein